MKNYSLLLLLILFFNNNLSAQDYKKELLKSYTTQELNGFPKSKIRILEYALENSCYFTPLPEGKTMDFPEIEIKKQVVNFTGFGLKIEDFTQYFIVKNQNKLLVIKSSYILDLEIKNKEK
jgi:hypothetical protein